MSRGQILYHGWQRGYSQEYLTNPNTIDKLKRREPLQPVRMTKKVDGVDGDGMFSPRVVVNPKTGQPMVRAEQCYGKDILQMPYMGCAWSGSAVLSRPKTG